MTDGIDLRAVDSDEDDAAADRITHRAFGHAYDPSAYARRRPERRSGRFYLASRMGELAGSGGALDLDLTVPGGATVPVSAITGIGVTPDHRRSGIMSAVMGRLIDDALERGQAAAILYASEATIYPRFAFGLAVQRAQAKVEVRRSAFRPGTPLAAGRVRSFDLSDEPLRGLVTRAYESSLRRRPGEIRRTAAIWDARLARREGGDDRIFLVHLDDGGEPDGYVSYGIKESWSGSGPGHESTVNELMAADDAVELSLWRALFDHDLVQTVDAQVPLDWLVRDALVDAWGLRMRWNAHSLWARLLDVPAALSRRSYRSPGRLVIAVRDETRPQCGGTFRLEVGSEGGATCERSTKDPHLIMDVSVLAEIWLGGWSAARLARAGRIHEATPGAAVRADLMFGWDPAPFTTHEF